MQIIKDEIISGNITEEIESLNARIELLDLHINTININW